MSRIAKALCAFNTDISSWSLIVQGTGFAVYSTLDAGGSGTSGSMQTTSTSAAAGQNYS